MGKTLVEHALDYANNSKLISQIVVTTESDEVRNLTHGYDNIILLDRDRNYMGEREVADVYVNVVQEIESDILKNITHVVGIQPDHPDRKTNVDELLEYVVSNKYDDFPKIRVELEMVQRVTKKSLYKVE